ncbi:MAG: 30S ribosomal protein S19e [Candidatus Woesearchaeota archaeon]
MPLLEEYSVQAFLHALADELKEKKYVEPPMWAMIVKTGRHKERPPMNNNWWYLRSASILRTIALKGPIGVSKLRTKYGGKRNRGHKPSHFYKGSGSIIRKILQQLEKSKLIKQAEIKHHKGRIITAEGKQLLKSVAKKLEQ